MFSVAFDQLVTKMYIKNAVGEGILRAGCAKKPAIGMCCITVIVFTLIILERYHRQCSLIELPVITLTFSGV